VVQKGLVSGLRKSLNLRGRKSRHRVVRRLQVLDYGVFGQPFRHARLMARASQAGVDHANREQLRSDLGEKYEKY
jgi:hypothetical protein